MSTTTTKRPHGHAKMEALDFMQMFPRSTYERWEIAGSIRRERPMVGDVEHVIIPRFGEVPNPASMFGEPTMENLFLRRCDELLAEGFIAKHEYEINRADGTKVMQHRWGEKLRGIDYRGHMHELFLADKDNFGCVLTIRTGPAEFSERLVTLLHHTALRQKDGYLRYHDGTIYPCPDEREFFAACRVAWREPKDRA